MDTQQALILKEVQRPLVLDTRPIPEPNGNQVLVRIVAAGSMICRYIELYERKADSPQLILMIKRYGGDGLSDI